MIIEKIKRLELRDIWKHEAYDFTTWLEENTDVLSEVVGFELHNVEREQSTGNFNVDLLAENSDGQKVIIENQLGKSDHDHLGKIVTYLSSFEAKISVWIVSDARPEHINAITWLNELSSDYNFFLIKIEAIQIGDSNPAPLLTLIVGPSEELKELGSAKKHSSERNQRRYKFWTGLLKKGREMNHKLFNSNSPTHYNWIGTKAGLSGINYSYWLADNHMTLRIYIDRGKDMDQENLKIFEEIYKHKEKIEGELGYELEWNKLEKYRACTISKKIDTGGLKSDKDNWDQIYNDSIAQMMKLEKATKSIISNIKI